MARTYKDDYEDMKRKLVIWHTEGSGWRNDGWYSPSESIGSEKTMVAQRGIL